jgi:hypothetical protein
MSRRYVDIYSVQEDEDQPSDSAYRRAPTRGETRAATRVEARATGSADDDARTDVLRPTGTSQHEIVGTNNLVIRTHDGTGYILPRVTWEASTLTRHCIALLM